LPAPAYLSEKTAVSVNTLNNKDRDQKNTKAPSSRDEVEAYEASNGADMPIFANILPKPMSTPPSEGTTEDPALGRRLVKQS
jgi:hypothetical protein